MSEALRQFQQKERAHTSVGTTPLSNLGLPLPEGADIEALAYVVLMEATKSASDDLKAIMGEVKAMTKAKEALRNLICKICKDIVTNAGQINGRPPLDLSNGMGSEHAYHQAPMPIPDPCSSGGIRFVPTNLFDDPIDDVADLRVIVDALKGQLDSMSEIGEMESLRLQMAMDRRSKLMSTLSNIMKKISDTEANITQNLK